MRYSGVIKNGIKTFYPGYFALVMATGIISAGCRQMQMDKLGKVLFMLNNLQYFILLFVFIGSLFFFFPQFKEKLADHSKGAGFLTFVAGSCVLGTGYVQGKQSFSPGIILLTVSMMAWVLLIYIFLSLVITKKEKTSFEKGMNGSWLLLIVSTQSMVVLGSLLLSHLTIPQNVTSFTLLAGWLTGIVLYVVVISLMIFRLIFYPLTYSEMSPTDWIMSGAAAITTLAGVTLSGSLTGMQNFQQYIHLINLLSLLSWATATFLLPLLFVLEIWKNFNEGFKYTPAYWSMVFPLGMYAVATLQLASAFQLPFLNSIAHAFLLIAVVAWIVTFFGMIKNVIHSFL